ncbi:hypothetical protein L484_020656 [Morus notabilis]|uniref:Uncharacterized protein n=1 Tax=Morus notabilis TaxID=981085 RepID=W9SXJ8_9ROSA|nr:hypothetical protein L484_020656 [Morus notabilis]
MDEKENQSLGMCHRLFNFIMKSLALQALKKSTLGCPTNHSSAAAPPSDAIHGEGETKSDQMVHPTAQGLENTNTSKNSDSTSSLGSLLQNDQVKDDEEFRPSQGIGDAERAEEEISAQPKPPKKTVSINDRAEDIHKIMKKRKKSNSFDRSYSLENGEDEHKSLRSILKVGSNLDDNTEAYVVAVLVGQMNTRQYLLTPFGICQRIFEWIMQILAAQALKTVTLGQPESRCGSSSAKASSTSAPPQ